MKVVSFGRAFVADYENLGAFHGNFEITPDDPELTPFAYGPGVDSRVARLRAGVESLKVENVRLLREVSMWRKKADEDAGRLKRYSDALFEIAHRPAPDGNMRAGEHGYTDGFEEFADKLQERARIELSATAMVGHSEGPAA